MYENALLSAKKSEIKIENRASQKKDNCLSQSISSPVEKILFLQRTIGNQAVERLIRSDALHTILRAEVRRRVAGSSGVGPNSIIGANQFEPERPQIQLHPGDHSNITTAQNKYQHTFNHAGISQISWESGYMSKNFLGVNIRGGVHRELADRLSNAETFLRGRHGGISDPEIANRIGLRTVEGRRVPGIATGTNRISFHAFGLAIDVNKRQNIYIAHNVNEAQIIERATGLILGRPVNMRMNTGGRSAVELRNIYKEASDALLTYFGLPGVRQSTTMLLRMRGRPTDEGSVERLWEQISDDRVVLMRQNTGWDPNDRGFIDLTEDLVLALTDNNGGALNWLGQHQDGKDLMHFDWRNGTIRHSHRI